MKKVYVLLLMMVMMALLIGCSNATEGNEVDKSFQTRDEALEFGLEQEDIQKDDILEIMGVGNVELVIFRFDDPDGEGITIAELANEDGEYQWKRNLQRVVLKSTDQTVGNLNVNATFQVNSNEEYHLYLGLADKEKMTINTPQGEVSPSISNGMYYYIYSE